jgi:hypothetical protein
MRNLKRGTFLGMAAIIILGFAFIGCDDKGGKTNNDPIPKTYPITTDKVSFDVNYVASPNDVPSYLPYLKGRLMAFMGSTEALNVYATGALYRKAARFTITIEYEGDSYEGMKWDAASQSFQMHNNWISDAFDTDLSFSMIRIAFTLAAAE